MISEGDPIPDVEIRTPGPEGPVPVRTADVFGTGRSVLFGVPGAFTPNCDRTHLPGFVTGADEILARGIDRIACLAVNDCFVMDAWGKTHGVGDKILMLADGNGTFTRSMGLEMDGSQFGLGTRSKRYCAIIEDRVVTRLDVDERGTVDLTACEALLHHI